jgi:hypothetical protein
MTRVRIQHLLVPALLLVSSTAAQAAPRNARLSVFSIDGGRGSFVQANLKGAHGTQFLLYATANPRIDPVGRPVAAGWLDQNGEGRVRLRGGAFASTTGMAHFRASYRDLRGSPAQTPWQPLGAEPDCERLSFSFAESGDELQAGEIIADQWADAGLQIRAVTNGPGPDNAIIFDSANPTGGDDDLMTPGSGPGNTIAMGNLLILAEDTIDANQDGLVDDPDDDEDGGTIFFEFARPVTLCRFALIDLDKGGIGSIARFFDDEDQLLREIELPSAGNNSAQIVSFLVDDVSRMEIVFVGSGGIPFVELIPCPAKIDFDTNTFGQPENLQPGQPIDGMVNGLEFTIQTQNNTAGHPDQAIIFDTANPTGGDPDLRTPGPGIGNNTPRGKVLVIAENDNDFNNDGNVDVPDDEAFGGVMFFDFEEDVIFQSATVLDIDTNENSFFVLRNEFNASLSVIPLAPLGDNSSQTVESFVEGVRRIELHLSGSGALAELLICPEGLVPDDDTN